MSELKTKSASSTSDEEGRAKTRIIELSKSIFHILSTLIESNKKKPNYEEQVKKQSSMACFSAIIPSISLLDYLIRLFEYSKCEESSIILTLIYIDRACSNGVFLTPFIIYRLLSAGLILSLKFNEDIIVSNEYFSKIAGITKANLNRVEYEFIGLLRCELFINEERYLQYKNYLDNIINKMFKASK